MTFFITTAIDYTNAAPHIGHAYEKVLADVLARYHRLKGDEVFFLTGVDQHGQKVQQSAEKQGIAPQEFVDGVTAKFVALWEKLDVRYDAWAATTDERHKECVRKILTRLNDEGQIYKAKRAGYYSVRQEQFLTDKERGEDGEFGPEWGQVEFREEENYYFKLAEHKDWLLDLIKARSEAGRPLVVPEFRVAELRNAVEKLEGDLCISRPKSRLSWGIEFPFDPEFVTYVWFDALVNYISFAPGFDLEFNPEAKPSSASLRFKDLWPPLHVIGKDIMIPAHGVYWPIMLKAIGFTADEIPPLLVHGFWNMSGAKMSKSLGNIVDPDQGVENLKPALRTALEKVNSERVKKKEVPILQIKMDEIVERCAPEAVRYYLVSDIATGKDADFSEERLIQRYNTDLANSLGNLLNRTLSMVAKFRACSVTCPPYLRERMLREVPHASIEGEPDFPSGSPLHWVQTRAHNAGSVRHAYVPSMDRYAVSEAMSNALYTATYSNELIQLTAPWELAKAEKENPAIAVELDAVLYHLAESLRIIAILISPVLPKAAAGIFAQLNWDKDEHGNPRPFRLEDAKWGGLPDGHVLGTPTPLFPRIEIPPPA